MASYYPIPGFYFKVVVIGDLAEIASTLINMVGLTSTVDGSFQEVTGLNVEMPTEDLTEGGENRYIHSLPLPLKYPNLVLKRGLTGKFSGLLEWVQDVMTDDISEQSMEIAGRTLNMLKKHILVMALSPEGLPLMLWNVMNAYPVKWEISRFDSMKNEYVVETMEFKYQRFIRLNLDNPLMDMAREQAAAVLDSPLVKAPLEAVRKVVDTGKDAVEDVIDETTGAVGDAFDPLEKPAEGFIESLEDKGTNNDAENVSPTSEDTSNNPPTV